MKPFNRERFLFYLLATVLGYQALLFGWGIYKCSTATDGRVREICPDIGNRFDSFSERTLAAVLGLIAGGAAVSSLKKTSSDGPDGSLASPPPQLPQQPSPEDSLEPAVKPISPNQAKGPAPVSVPVTAPAKEQGSARGRARG